jgi:dTDP-glucose 4,6-dehydratase
MILVTGGAGFIGANFVLDWFERSAEPVVNLDKLTYAGNLGSLAPLRGNAGHVFVRGDIGDRACVEALLAEHRPRAIVNFAAESHVDRSIHGPAAFVETNVVGTFTLLEAARAFWSTLPATERAAFRFLHVSTDEVYGSLRPTDPPFAETTPYAPNSPYSATKAAADHLVRAYHHTYGLPTLTTNCSNNYGPRQFPEKLIPLMIVNALAGKALPVYGDGRNVRDWLPASPRGDSRGARQRPRGDLRDRRQRRMSNLDVVHAICRTSRSSSGRDYPALVTLCRSPGHDRRRDRRVEFDETRPDAGGDLRDRDASHRQRYLDNEAWLAAVTSREYQKWFRSTMRKRWHERAGPSQAQRASMSEGSVR